MLTNADGRALALRTAKEEVDSPEARLRRAWFYAGTSLREALDDQYEFVILHSDTKVIDQLQGAHVDDEDCEMMHNAIVRHGIPRFVFVEYKKTTTQDMTVKFRNAQAELAGNKNERTEE